MDRRKISRHVQADRAAGPGRAMGGHWRDVGGARFEYAGRRITDAADPGRQALLSKPVRRGREDRMESGFVRLQRAIAADLQKVWHGLLCHAEAAVGA